MSLSQPDMKLKTGYEHRRARIDMIPLIDVVFLLLVFFVYAMLSMIVHRGVKVDMPDAVSPHRDPRQALVLTVSSDNLIYIGDQQVEMQRLAPMVSERLLDTPDLPVLITGDTHSDLGVSIEILSRLRAAGVSEVAFQAQPTH